MAGGEGVGRERIRLGVAPVGPEYKSDFGIGERSKPENGRKEKGERISKTQIERIKESSGNPGLNRTTPPSPTSAGGKERRAAAAARAPAQAPGQGGTARGAVGVGGRLRGREPGQTDRDLPEKEGGQGTCLPPGGRGGSAGVRAATTPLFNITYLSNVGAGRDLTKYQGRFQKG